MSTATPPSIPLPDYDGDGPGRLVKKDGGGANQNDPTKYQQWSFDASGQTVSVHNFRIWAAAKDFDNDKDVRFRAYLLDCGGSCNLLQQSAVVTVRSSGWRQVTVPFNVSNLSFGSGRSLVVKITVVDDSDDDMWFAYGTSTYNARLTVSIDTPPPATTTTTTSPATTSTAQAAATTTTLAGAPTTSVAPGETTTSAGATTTTLAGVSTTTTARIEVVAAPEQDDGGGDGETGGDPDPGTETVNQPPPVVFSTSSQSQAVELFETPHDLQPAEGLMVAFATVTETIGLYWQAAVGLGSVAAVLVWRGLATGREWEESDDTLQPPGARSPEAR
ncbi:MAG TPA: hypothetical protein VI141_04820 [Acidimicrobiia bacterium]